MNIYFDIVYLKNLPEENLDKQYYLFCHFNHNKIVIYRGNHLQMFDIQGEKFQL